MPMKAHAAATALISQILTGIAGRQSQGSLIRLDPGESHDLGPLSSFDLD